MDPQIRNKEGPKYFNQSAYNGNKIVSALRMKTALFHFQIMCSC